MAKRFWASFGCPIFLDSAEAHSYHRRKLTIFFVGSAFHAALLIFLYQSALPLRWLPSLIGAEASFEITTLTYLALFYQITFFATLPLSFYSGFLTEKKFSLSRQSLAAWIADAAKRYALGLGLFLLTGGFFYYVVRHYPDAWWWILALAWLVMTLFFSRIMPTLIISIFYSTKPLPEGELKQTLLELCRRCRVSVNGIFEIALSKKTRKANAALVGIGKSRRILLGDTLLKNFTQPEIEMVMAHEIGHHALKHISRSILMGSAATVAGFFIFFVLTRGYDLSDLRWFPLLSLGLFLVNLFSAPIQNAVSRQMEREADRYALQKYDSQETFTSLMNRLAEQNLAVKKPHPWIEFLFYDHPSIDSRIRYAQKLSHGGSHA